MEEINNHIDIAEIGTPVIKIEGLEAVKAVKDIAKHAQQVDTMGIDYICVHTGYDLQAKSQTSFADLRTTKSVVKNARTAIAGGIANTDDKRLQMLNAKK